MSARSTSVRVAAARARLSSDENVWIATASVEGVPHLVPLSLAWLDDRIVVATPSTTATARNATATGRARVALDSADDVVIFDVRIDVMDYHEVDGSVRRRFSERVGWDPADQPGEWALLVMQPVRGQAWSGPGEISGRTIVRDADWLST